MYDVCSGTNLVPASGVGREVGEICAGRDGDGEG